MHIAKKRADDMGHAKRDGGTVNAANAEIREGASQDKAAIGSINKRNRVRVRDRNGIVGKVTEFAKQSSKIVMLACCVCALAIIGVAYAAISGGGTTGITFTNMANSTPDLYISKTVDAADGKQIPPEEADTEFSFYVEVNGSAYSKKEYELYANGDLSSTPEHAVTDGAGYIYLKAGQVARFPYVGSGKSYVVSEDDVPDIYEVSAPARGDHEFAGTIDLDGEACAFVNTYVGERALLPTYETTTLTVRKDIAMPDSVNVPDEGDIRESLLGEHSFYVEVDGGTLAGATGALFGSDGVAYGSVSTDENGIVTIPGNSYVEFEGVPVGCDYSVVEVTASDDGETSGIDAGEIFSGGWWCADGNVERAGAVTGVGDIARFVDSRSSFVVYVKMDDGSVPDDEFEFVVTDGDGKVASGIPVYIVDGNGDVVGDVDGDECVTDENGMFHLKAEQRAVLGGLAVGSGYSVRQVLPDGYGQMVPNDPSGYPDKVVRVTPEVLPFVNGIEEVTGSLVVSKEVTSTGEYGVPSDASFSFELEVRDDASESGWIPVGDAVYETREGVNVMKGETDADGVFSLVAGQSVKFPYLPAGEYRVREDMSALGSEYSIASEEQEQTARVSASAGASLTFNNLYTRTETGMPITLVKQDLSDKSVISGVEFGVYRDEKCSDGVLVCMIETGEDGRAVSPTLKTGTYFVKEIEPAEGYQDNKRVYSVEVTANSDAGENIEQVEAGGEMIDAVTVDGDDEGGVVYNAKKVSLPFSGQMGFAALIVIGLVLVIGGISIEVRRRKRNSIE